MLRKSLVAILILLYSASAIGVPLHFHYCRGELKHITLFVKKECHIPGAVTSEHACCQNAKPHCSVSKSFNSCCDDATQWLQEHTPAVCAKSHDRFEIPAVLSANIPAQHDPLRETHVVVSVPHTEMQTGPPRYLLQCALIFYG